LKFEFENFKLENNIEITKKRNRKRKRKEAHLAPRPKSLGLSPLRPRARRPPTHFTQR
jgi:hypothetical protein